jgi:RimJ/RimL family protein N-acetyltransferase
MAPKLRLLTPDDRGALENFLLPRVETSMFLIGNMRAAGLVDRGEPFQGTYVGAFEGHALTAVVAHYWNGNLVLQAPLRLPDLWRAAVALSRRPVAGLIGPPDQVQAVCNDLALQPREVQMDETEKLYSLALSELRVPNQLLTGRWTGRRATNADLHLLARWRAAYSIETLGADETPELIQECSSATARAIARATVWVLEDGDRPVSTSAFNTAIDEAVQVGGVWTPPDLRNRGYGRAVVAASLIDARASGVSKAILFTGKDNVPAQHAYQALNFRPVGTYRIVLLRFPRNLASRGQ